MSELPPWAAEMRDLFRSGSAAEFIVHGNVFDLVTRGVLRVEIGQRLPLAEAARAHRELEARRTIGATVLLP